MNVSVVLAGPQDNRNIGAVARALKTLGFSELVLVAPESYNYQEACISACHSEDVLDRAQIFPSLKLALEGFQDVVGFSGRTGRDRLEHQFISDWLPTYFKTTDFRTALVFGNERTGLSREDLTHCRHVVALPTINSQPSYNLAQAVLLVLYQLRFSNLPTGNEASDFQPANWAQYDQLSKISLELGSQSGFFRSGSSAVVKEIFPRILKRIQLGSRECDILIGFASKLLTTLESKEKRGEDEA